MHRLVVISGALLTLLLALTGTAAAQQQLPELSLEELMRMDSGRVFGASERIQPVTEAPASVSFITAEEIAKYGYRTLADILRGVRGMYVSDDRNFSLLGMRGFGKPGDYNSRILLLVNGHRVNDNVFGQAEIGAEFGIDPAMFERVEIIRGPASSLYGDSAFFAVVNVITKSGASLGGGTLALEGGTLGTRLARASTGHRFANGVDVAVSGTFEESAGMERIYFPAFDTPETNNGVAEGLDGERVGQFYGQVSAKNLTFTGAYGRRQRDVPTASFGTLFNAQQSSEQTTDRHTLADLEYRWSFGHSRLTARASFDQFSYDGTYPFGRAGSVPTLVATNTVVGARWSAGARLTRPLPGRQTLTLGAEFIDNVRQDQLIRYSDPARPGLDSARSSMQHALYAQDEVRLARWLIVNGGLRYDRYEDFVRVTPRAALIAMPSSDQSFKYLYGRAFRAPNAYELTSFYFGERTYELGPETIDTHELVWERYTNDWLRTAVSAYWYQADGLITLTDDPSAALAGTTFVNEGHVSAHGLELEAQMRLKGQLHGLMSYALQDVKDLDTGAALVNSPRQMAKFRMSAPFPTAASSLSLEALFLGSRKTIMGEKLDSAVTANLTMIHPVSRSVEVVGSIRNLLNELYADPVSDAHVQDSIPQNGRTLRIGLRWKLWAR